MESELKREKFTRVDMDKEHYYYSFKTDTIEICIEPCAGGFCVAPFSLASDPLDKDMLEPRKCTNSEGYLRSAKVLLGDRKKEDWDKALEYANDIHKRLGGNHVNRSK